MTGIPLSVLIRMRDRNNRSLKSGPPFHKVISKGGTPTYEYKAAEVRDWMRIKLCQITAGDAANIMGITREEILDLTGVQAFQIKNEYQGKLVVNNTANIYIWLPAKNKRKKLSL